MAKRKTKARTKKKFLLDFGLDIYSLEIVENPEHVEFLGRINSSTRQIVLNPSSHQKNAHTMMHEVLHYVDEKYAREALQKADQGATCDYHPTLDLTAQGLLTIFLRNWPFWQDVFNKAYKEQEKEKRND